MCYGAAMAEERVARTHLRRTARLGGTAAAIAVRTTGARVTGGRSEEAKRQAVLRHYVPEGISLSEELIRERRAEAAG